MPKGTCSIDGCEETPKARGWCKLHYERWQRRGDPRAAPSTLEERFWRKVDKNGPIPEHRPELGPCWVWTAGTNTRRTKDGRACRVCERDRKAGRAT